jgi:hypothetical protein
MDIITQLRVDRAQHGQRAQRVSIIYQEPELRQQTLRVQRVLLGLFLKVVQLRAASVTQDIKQADLIVKLARLDILTQL